jgi:transposase
MSTVCSKAKYNRRLKRYLNYRQIRDLAFAAFPELVKAYELKEYYISMNIMCIIDTAPEMISSAISVLRTQE